MKSSPRRNNRSPETTTCRSEAVRRKREGIKKATKHAGPWSDRARAAIARIPTGTKFTVEDLRTKVRGEPPHANAWGTVFHNAHREGLILRANFAQSTRPESHARVVAIWVRL